MAAHSQNAGRWAERVVLIDGPTGTSITFSELHTMIRACASGLRSRGFKRDDVLGTWRLG